jgi:hypothetical protein
MLIHAYSGAVKEYNAVFMDRTASYLSYSHRELPFESLDLFDLAYLLHLRNELWFEHLGRTDTHLLQFGVLGDLALGLVLANTSKNLSMCPTALFMPTGDPQANL